MRDIRGVASTTKRFQIPIIFALVVSILFLVIPSALSSQVPYPPTNLSAIPISPTSVSLSWSLPQYTSGSHITGYILEWKSAPDYHYSPISVGNVTTYTHSGLTTGNTYIYRVSALNGSGQSAPSSPEQQARPTSSSAPPKNIAPNPPTGLVATPVSVSQLNLSWNPPTSNGGYPVTAYKIQYKIDSGSFADLVSNTGTTTTSYSHTGLSSTHTYTYQVFAINSVGTSNASNTATATPSVVSSIPNPPTGLAATSTSPTGISLSWTAPQNNGGSAIIGYKIEYRIGSGAYAVLVANTGTSTTTFLSTGLTAGTTYTYRVSAINSLGTGNPSNEASATPTKTLVPSGVTAIAVSPTEIDLSWNPPSETFGQTITGYKIDRKFSTGAFDNIVENTGTATSYPITGLTTGKTYTFVVTALFSGGGESSPSAEASATPTSTSKPPTTSPPPSSNPPPANPPPQTPSVPDPPTSLNATINSPTSVRLSWLAPANVGKPTITGYQIEFKIGSGPWLILSSNVGTITTYLHPGLANGTYFYRVSSVSFSGLGNPSTTASVTLGTSSSTTPPVIESSGGMMVIAGTDYSVRYSATGSKLLGITADQTTFSLNIQLQAKNDGTLSLDLPRDLIDAKKSDGTDDDFIVVTGKQVLLKFDEAKGTSQRSLTISVPAGTDTITIYGTHVVPEFPVSVLVLVIALVSVIFFSKTIKIQKLNL